MSEDLYKIAPVRGYNTLTLFERGENLISPKLVPALKLRKQAFADVQESTKLLACQFWTASGFHIARATEFLLQEYWKHLRKTDLPPPSKRTWVQLCRDLRGSPDKNGVLRTKKDGKQRLILSIQSLGSEYRNPLIHPEHSLDEQDGLLLFQGCIAAIEGLLKELL